MLANDDRREKKVISLADALAALKAKHGDKIKPGAAQPARAICPTCEGRGVIQAAVPVGHADFGRLMACPAEECEQGKAYRARVWANRLRTAKIPPDYQHWTLPVWAADVGSIEGKRAGYAAACLYVQAQDRRITTEAIQAAIGREMGEPTAPKPGLVFFGPVGTGKTALAAAIANEVVAAGGSVLFTKAIDLIKEVQRRYKAKTDAPYRFEDDPEYIIDLYGDAPLLILDDCNIADSPDRQEIIERVIERRHVASAPTVITTNLDADGFERAWGDRTSSRVRHMCHWIKLGGVMLRRRDPIISD